MITFLDIDADNALAINVNGKIGSHEFDAVVALLEKKMQDHANVRIYIEMEAFKGFSPEAFLKDLKFGISNWKRFDKEAIVTEKKWVQKLSEIGNKLFSDIEVRTFYADEKEKAKAWIQE